MPVFRDTNSCQVKAWMPRSNPIVPSLVVGFNLISLVMDTRPGGKVREASHVFPGPIYDVYPPFQYSPLRWKVFNPTLITTILVDRIQSIIRQSFILHTFRQ